MDVPTFRAWWQTHRTLFDAVDHAREPAALGRVTTAVTPDIDPSFDLDLRELVQAHYREITQAGLPDGPSDQRS